MPDNKDKLYQALKGEGFYTKSQEDFNAQFETEEGQQKLYEAMTAEGLYSKPLEDFQKQFFFSSDQHAELVGESTTSVSEGGGLDLSQIETEQLPFGVQDTEVSETVVEEPVLPTHEEKAAQEAEDKRQKQAAKAAFQEVDNSGVFIQKDNYLDSEEEREAFIQETMKRENVKRSYIEEELQRRDAQSRKKLGEDYGTREEQYIQGIYPGDLQPQKTLTTLRMAEGRSMLTDEEQKIAKLSKRQRELAQKNQTEPLGTDEIEELWNTTAEIKKLTDDKEMLFNPSTGNYVDKKEAPQEAKEYEEKVKSKQEVYTATDMDDLIRIFNQSYLEYKALDERVKEQIPFYKDMESKMGRKLADDLSAMTVGEWSTWDRMGEEDAVVRKAHRLKDEWEDAKADFDAINRALQLNQDPADIERGFVDFFKILGETTIETAFDKEIETNRDLLEHFVTTVQEKGGKVTEDQLDRLEKDLSDKVAEGLGTSIPLMFELASTMVLMETGVGAVPALARLGKTMETLLTNKYGKTGKFIYNLAKETARGTASFAATPSEDVSAIMGGAEGFTQGVLDNLNPEEWLKKSKYGKLIGWVARTAAGTMAETAAEFAGDYADNLKRQGFDAEEAFKETFGHDVETFADKLLLTAIISGSMSGTFNAMTLNFAQKQIDELPDTEENQEAKEFVKQQREDGITGEEPQPIITADEVEGKSIKDLEVTPPAEPTPEPEAVEEKVEEVEEVTEPVGEPDVVSKPVELKLEVEEKVEVEEEKIVAPEEVIETTETTPEPQAVQEGDQVALPPRVEGGLERTFEYSDGEWKQRAGDELSGVSEKVQEQVQQEFEKEAPPVKVEEELFSGRKEDGEQIIDKEQKTFENVLVVPTDQELHVRALAEKGDTQAQETVKRMEETGNVFAEADKFMMERYGDEYDAIKYENENISEKPVEYHDLKENKFWTPSETLAKQYALADRSKKFKTDTDAEKTPTMRIEGEGQERTETKEQEGERLRSVPEKHGAEATQEEVAQKTPAQEEYEKAKTEVSEGIEELMRQMGGLKDISPDNPLSNKNILDPVKKIAAGLLKMGKYKGQQFIDELVKAVKKGGITQDHIKEYADQIPGVKDAMPPPKKKKPQKKERRFYTRMKGSKSTLSPGLWNRAKKADPTYTVLTDIERISYANQLINLAANTQELLDLRDMVKNEMDSLWGGEDGGAFRKTTAEKLAYKLESIGKSDEAFALMDLVARIGTEAGKTVSSFRDTTPEGQVLLLSKELNEAKKAAFKQKVGKKTVGERVKTTEEQVKNTVKDVVEEMTQEGGAVDKATKNTKKPTSSQKIRNARKKQKAAIDKLKKINVASSSLIGVPNEFIEGVGELAAAIAEEGIYRIEDIVKKTVDALNKANIDHDESTVENIVKGDQSVKQTIERNVSEDAEAIAKKSLPETINQIVKKHYTEKASIRKSLGEKIAEETGLDGDAAKRIAKKIENAFDKLMKEKGTAVLNSLFEGEPSKKKASEMYQSVIDAINMGALDSEQFSDLFADHFGFSALTPEMKQELIDFANKMQSEQSPEMLNRTLRDFNDLMEEIKDDKSLLKKVIEFALERFYMAVLSGFSTVERAVKGAMLSGIANYLKTTMSNPIASIYATPMMLKAGIRQWKSSVDIIKTGHSEFDFIDYKPSSRRFYDRLANKTFSDLWREGKDKGKVKAAVKMALKFEAMLPTYMYRTLLAVDSMFKYGIKEHETFVQQYNKELLSEGGTLVGNAKRAAEFYSNLNQNLIKINQDLALDQEAQAEIDAELEAEMQDRRDRGDNIPFGFEQRRRQEMVDARRDEEINKEASKRALKWILMGTPEGTLGAMYNAVNSFLNKETNHVGFKGFQLLGHTVFPFLRVGINAMSLGLDFTFVGAFRGIVGLSTGTKLSGQGLDLVPKSADESVRQLAASALGMGLGMSLVKSLFDFDDDDIKLAKNPFIEITAMGTGDYYENLQTAKDYQANSFRLRIPEGVPERIKNKIGVKENGVWWTQRYSYVDNPALGYFFFPLGMMSDQIRYADPSKEKEDSHLYGAEMRVIGNYLYGMSLFGMQQSYQQGVKDLNNLMPNERRSSEDGINRWIEHIEKMTVKRAQAVTTPNLYKQMYKQVKALVDVPQRDAKTVAQMYYKDQPLFEVLMSGKQQTDAFGHPIITEFDIPLFPDILIDEAEKIIKDRRETSKEWQLVYKFPEVTLGGRQRIRRIDNHKLTPEEQYQVEEHQKVLFREKVLAAFDERDTAWMNDPVELQKFFNRAKRQSTKEAKDSFLNN